LIFGLSLGIATAVVIRELLIEISSAAEATAEAEERRVAGYLSGEEAMPTEDRGEESEGKGKGGNKSGEGGRRTCILNTIEEFLRRVRDDSLLPHPPSSFLLLLL
jgi:hypothetical protein